MCCLDSDKGKYEFILLDKSNNPLFSIDFSSISLLCRALDDVDLDRCNVQIYRKSDLQFIDEKLLLEMWRNK